MLSHPTGLAEPRLLGSRWEAFGLPAGWYENGCVGSRTRYWPAVPSPGNRTHESLVSRGGRSSVDDDEACALCNGDAPRAPLP